MKRFYTLMFSCLWLVMPASATNILGTPQASIDRMYQFVMSKNPGASFSREIAAEFYNQGVRYGIRGDIALCQSCIETGWFRYSGGTAVTPSDHNYCGLGVTTLGQKGCQFSTMAEGVSAQLQHLWAYATTAALPSGWTLVDPRFRYVNRGSAPSWESLGGKWATSTSYGYEIISIYNQMMSFTVANPSLKSSASAVALSAEQNSAAPSERVAITGRNLTSPIIFNPSNSAVKVSTSGWDNYAGGTLVITLDTSRSPGTYTGYVAVQSGSGDSRQRVEIQFTATILESSGGGGTPATLDLRQVWNRSQAAGNAGWATAVRNLDYAAGVLYCVRDHAEIIAVDAGTGSLMYALPASGVTGGTLALCDVKALGGKVFACNLSTSATANLKVYQWDDDAAVPRVILDTPDKGSCARLGDCMDMWGNPDGALNIAFAYDNGSATTIVVYSRTSPSAAWNVATTKVTAGGSYFPVGVSARVRRCDDGGWWIDAKNIHPTRLNAAGQVLYAYAGEPCTHGNDFQTFTYAGRNYLLLASYLNKSASTYADGMMRLFDVTGSWTADTPLATMPAAGLGPTRNINTTGSLRVNVSVSGVEAWILVTGQGIAKYTSSSSSSSVIDGIAGDNSCRPEIVIAGSCIRVTAPAISIEAYTIAGVRVAVADGDTLDTRSLPSGVYIVTARLRDAAPLTAKIHVR